MPGCKPTLNIRSARQSWHANHIAHSVNVRLRSLKMLIDFKLPAMVRFHTDVFQSQAFGVTGSTVGPQKDVALQLLARLQMHHHMVIKCLQLLKRFTVTHAHACVSHVIGQRITDFVVEEFEHLGACIHQIEFDLQVSKH